MKKLLITIAVVFAAGVTSAAIAIPTLISPQLAKHEIAERISAWTGARATIGGETVVKILPTVVVEVKDISLEAESDAADAPTLTIPTLQASIEILPLLFGRTEIEALTLVQPAIHTVATETGGRNWPTGCLRGIARLGTPPSELAGLKHGALVVRDGVVTCLERGTSRLHSITAGNLRIAWAHAAASAKLSGTFRWRDKLVEVELDVEEPQKILAGAGSFGRAYLAVGTTRETLVEKVGVPMGSNSQFGSLEVSGKVKASRNSFALSEATFELPGTTAEGNLVVSFDGERPSVTGSLTTNKLDLGRYVQELVHVSASELLALHVPVGWLGYADIDVTAYAAKANLGSLQFTNTAVKLFVRADRARLVLNESRLGDGHLAGSVAMSRTKDGTEVRFSGRLDDVPVADIGEALWDTRINRLVGTTEPPAGTASAKFDLSGVGGTVGALIESLDGWAAAAIRDGSIGGVDVVSTLERVAEGNTVIARGDAPFIPVAGRTRFAWMTVHMNFGGEVAQAERIHLVGDQFEVAVSGQGDLERGELVAQGEASLFASDAGLSRMRPVVQLPFGVGGTIQQQVLVPGIPKSGHLACETTLPLAHTWCGSMRSAGHRPF